MTSQMFHFVDGTIHHHPIFTSANRSKSEENQFYVLKLISALKITYISLVFKQDYKILSPNLLDVSLKITTQLQPPPPPLPRWIDFAEIDSKKETNGIVKIE